MLTIRMFSSRWFNLFYILRKGIKRRTWDYIVADVKSIRTLMIVQAKLDIIITYCNNFCNVYNVYNV